MDVNAVSRFALRSRYYAKVPVMSKLAQQSAKADGTHVFLVVWRTFRALLAASDASKKRLGLGDSDFRVLEVLLHKGPLAVNIIGGKVDLTTGSITTAIDRLEKKALSVAVTTEATVASAWLT